MAYLRKLNKSTLLLLATEFETDVSEDTRNKDIIQAILNASDYDEEEAKDYLVRIVNDLERVEREKELERKEREKELERKEREKELERKEREKELERKERDNIRQFELEKLRLQNEAEVNSTASTVTSVEPGRKRIQLRELVPKFDPKQIDISLFLMIFERQAVKEKVEEDCWVSQLIPLLPTDIAELIVKEPADKFENYQHIKKLLFKRFKLSALAFKNKFEDHNKKPAALWADLVYELRGYLDNWLEAVDVKDFESLKELILTEQIKKRVPFEIREHYLDTWEEINNATNLAEKCDKFEAVRRDHKKFERKNSFKKEKTNFGYSRNSYDAKGESDKQGKRELGKKELVQNEEIFEKPRKIICYLCGQAGHIRPRCPLNDKSEAIVNHVITAHYLSPSFRPYVKNAVINGVYRNYLLDSGSEIDICDRSWVNDQDWLGETVKIRQPLDSECISLPVARITIEGDFGIIVTKAAVKPIDLIQEYYLMGNKTARLIEAQRRRSLGKSKITSKEKLQNESHVQTFHKNNSRSPIQSRFSNAKGKKKNESSPNFWENPAPRFGKWRTKVTKLCFTCQSPEHLSRNCDKMKGYLKGFQEPKAKFKRTDHFGKDKRVGQQTRLSNPLLVRRITKDYQREKLNNAVDERETE